MVHSSGYQSAHLMNILTAAVDFCTRYLFSLLLIFLNLSGLIWPSWRLDVAGFFFSADPFEPLGTDFAFLEVGCCRMVNVDYVLEFDVP